MGKLIRGDAKGSKILACGGETGDLSQLINAVEELCQDVSYGGESFVQRMHSTCWERCTCRWSKTATTQAVLSRP